jgi:integrase
MRPENRKSITSQLEQLLGDDAEFVERKHNEFYAWMRQKGKDTNKGEPLSEYVARNYHSRIDQILRLVIERVQPNDRTVLTHHQADLIVKWLNEDLITKQGGGEYKETSKRKFTNAMQSYFDWRQHEGPQDEAWEPNITFTDGEHTSADKLNFNERWLVREEAKKNGSLPSYIDVSEGERDKINALVAQRLGKPKEDVTAKDWERADTSAKIGSLVAVASEAGLIPIEIKRARVGWYNESQNTLTITDEDSGKDRPTTEIPLSKEAGELLSQWIQERRHYEMYDGTDRLWLNNEGNPYTSDNLCYLIRKLFDSAGLDREGRKIVWYSLRHNMGQLMAEVGSIHEASDQLRHKDISTTSEFYAEASTEKRRRTIEKINKLSRNVAQDPDFDPYADDMERLLNGLQSGSSEPTGNEETNLVDGSEGVLDNQSIDAGSQESAQFKQQLLQLLIAHL